MQNLVVVSHNVCTHVDPKIFGISWGTATYWSGWAPKHTSPHLCYQAKFCPSSTYRDPARNVTSRPAFQGHSSSLEPTSIDHHRHHHHWVARPSPSVNLAVSKSWCHFERPCARIHAVLRPRLWGWRSSSIVRSHVRLGRPARRHQSAGGRLVADWSMHEWSCDGSALARCSNRRSHLFAIIKVIGGWPVLRLTSSLVICAVYGIYTTRRRHHWSNASRRQLESLVILHVSAP